MHSNQNTGLKPTEMTKHMACSPLIACDPNTEITKSSTRERLIKQPSPKNTSSVMMPGSDSIQQKDFTSDFIQNVYNSPLSTTILNNFIMGLKDCCKKVYNEYVVCDNILQSAIETNGYVDIPSLQAKCKRFLCFAKEKVFIF
ncbi:hypothetical protein PV327_004105 [Microctonus hyperodae]|uniref:Uncharacterized protein n=1 Tax=Microctonus hyperodae TaxID=165561 RepID=A0AA39KM55_MICHY|nr:hypothetical protein PV327_004105 [Microctonus hyperodae]